VIFRIVYNTSCKVAKPNIYYTAVLLVQIQHLAQSLALSSLNEAGNNYYKNFLFRLAQNPSQFSRISTCYYRKM